MTDHTPTQRHVADSKMALSCRCSAKLVEWLFLQKTMCTPYSTAQSFRSCAVAQCRNGASPGELYARQGARWFSVDKDRKRLEKLGIGPDGKPLPQPNPKKLYPRLYKTLLVQADGSTYTIRHRFPHKILALPIDPDSLSAEEKAERLKQRRQQEAPIYVDEEDEFDDEWSQSTYRELIDR